MFGNRKKENRDKSVAALTAGSPSVINVEIAVCLAFVPRSSLSVCVGIVIWKFLLSGNKQDPALPDPLSLPHPPKANVFTLI